MNLSPRSLILIGVGAVAGLTVFVGVLPRLRAAAELESRAKAMGHPAVNIVSAQRAAAVSELLLPADIQAFNEAPVFARTNGYLAQLNADLGDRVKAGQTLAVIEAPELDQELNQAKATLEQARANREIARLSAQRWQELGTQKAVSLQEVDEKQSTFAARDADLRAAEANVSRLTQLKQYQTISAPFDGVVSARNVDVGALISAGGSGKELFRIAQNDTLRVFVNVPQANMRSVKPGLPAEVLVNEFPGRAFTGKVVRVAGALDATSRTLLTEVQLPNQKGELIAGMFGQVRFRFPQAEPTILIPSNALIIRTEGTLVAVVGPENTVHFLRVKPGRDFGLQMEILSGLEEGAHVIANPSDALTEGMTVEPLQLATAKKP